MRRGRTGLPNDEPSNCKSLANKLAQDESADIIFINGPLMPPFDEQLRKLLDGRTRKQKDKLYVLLVTEGGLGDVAYRSCRQLQFSYRSITAVMSGWCKSAGTLFSAGAHEIVFGPKGELGPIDVQLRRADEIGERDSGLAVDTAFDALSEASFKLFERYMMGIKETSFGSVTFKTAADIAAQIAVGLVAPIFAQLDPIKVGEIHRSVRVAEEYAKRLALIGRNINRDDDFDGVDMLVRGYPSHGFAIDFFEARMVFRRVGRAEGTLLELLEALGDDAVMPRTSDGGPKRSNLRMEFLNDELLEEPRVSEGGGEQADTVVDSVDIRAVSTANAGALPGGVS